MRPKKSLCGGENSLSIPIDLVIEIFLKLPAKSIARFRCVSKLCASEIRRQDFTELFLTRSLARPQLLFACRDAENVFLFSADQSQNPPEEKNSCVVAANRLAHFPCDSKFRYDYELLAPVSGFLCLRLTTKVSRKSSMWVICNPSTGEYFPLPKAITKRKVGVGTYIGYDPSKKQFKVLSMTWLAGRTSISEEHQVMTLGIEQPSWKMVECCIPHYPGIDCGGICINGVLYYKAKRYESCMDYMIVCFDFSSEKFSFLEAEELYDRSRFHKPTMINYNGKVGLLMQDPPSYICGRSRSFELWVLEDKEKQEWSKHVYELPTLWKDVVGKTMLDFVGMIGTNEIVLSACFLSMPCYVFYLNIERSTITRVRIHGMEAFEGYDFRTFPNYADNVMLIQGL